jgi:hypothetical protein
MTAPVRRLVLATIAVCSLFLALYLPGAARKARSASLITPVAPLGFELARPWPRPSRTGPPPRLVPDAQEHDFGEIEQGSTVKHVFVLRNQGKGTANIFNTSSSCGCTASLLSRQEIPPGGQGRLEVTFKAGAMKGPFHKTVTVISDDPGSPLRLVIKGKVLPLITVEPESVDFGEVRPGGEVRRTVVLRPARPGVELRPLRPQTGNLPIEASQPRPGPSGSWVLELVARPERIQDPLTSALSIPTGNPTVPTLTLRFSGRVVP